MALIWVEGCTGDKALAPLWRDFALADAQRQDNTLSDERRAAAYIVAEKAKMKFDAATNEALQALAKRAQANEARTHVLIVGVGQYDDPGTFSNVSTSVHGARAFAEWMLTRFAKDDRPLGSLALVNSPTPDQGEWIPPKPVAERLGLTEGLDLPTEKATFANIKAAFEEFLNRAETSADNAAVYYFAGHGVYKSEPLALAQDSQLPSETDGAKNIIATVKTMTYMQNRQPSIQCFFIDTCSENNFDLTQNVKELPAEALISPKNGMAIAARDANVFLGSYPGKKAFGRENEAPFFTRELLLLACTRFG